MVMLTSFDCHFSFKLLNFVAYYLSFIAVGGFDRHCRHLFPIPFYQPIKCTHFVPIADRIWICSFAWHLNSLRFRTYDICADDFEPTIFEWCGDSVRLTVRGCDLTIRQRTRLHTWEIESDLTIHAEFTRFSSFFHSVLRSFIPPPPPPTDSIHV